MESSLTNYTLHTDNKGILSLLTAIEQSGDNYDGETSPSKILDKESLAVAENFSQLQNQLNLESLEMSGDLNLANFSPCYVCGRSPSIENPSENMVDIFTQLEIPGENNASATIFNLLEDIITIDDEDATSRCSSQLVCVDCVTVVDAILKLKAQIAEYTSTMRTRNEDWKKKRAKFPTVSDYTSVLDLKMPLNIFNVKEEESLSMPISLKDGSKKTKLDILAETLEEERRVANKEVEMDTFDRDLDGDEDEGDQLSLNKENEIQDTEELICDKCGNFFRVSKLKRRSLKTSCNTCVRESRNLNKASVTSSISSLKSLPSMKGFKEQDLKNNEKMTTIQQKENPKKSYSCSECPLTFTSKHNKAVHARLHKGCKGLKCDECGDIFQTFQTLQYHKSKHTGEFAYHCSSCGKGFNNFKLMEEHSHIHTGDRPYACQECDKSFANRGSLWLHRKKHEVKKPYVCDYCGKEFGHSSHLVVHKRMHTGETPYKCRFCNEGFISGNHLKRHMKTLHKNELPFACGICKQEFGKRSDLVRHGNSVHNGMVVDDVSSGSKLTEKISDPIVETPNLQSNSASPKQFADPAKVTASDKSDEGKVELENQQPRAEELIKNMLVDQEPILLNKLEEATDYVIPVSLIDDGDPSLKDGSPRMDQQTFVFIQIPPGRDCDFINEQQPSSSKSQEPF